METKDRNSQILELAIPAMIENILQTLVGFIDTLMISKIGLVAITAIGISNNIFSIYLAIFIAIGIGTSSLISRNLGGKNPETAKGIAIQSLILSLITGSAFGIITIFFGRFFLQFMRAEEEIISAAAPYFYVVGGFSLFNSLLSTMGSILRGSGDTKTPMAVNTIVNIVNIVVDYILIFGMGPIPALGVLGTAIGTVVARAVGCILMFRKLQNSILSFELRELFLSYDYDELIHLAIPAGLERLMMRLGQVIYFGLIVSMGFKTYAAHTIAGNIEGFTYMAALGFTTAASILVGNSIGNNDKLGAYNFAVQSAKLTSVIMSVGGLIMFFLSPYLARIFTEDLVTISKIVTALRIEAFGQIPIAVSLIMAGALQGLGDTKTPFYNTTIGMWGFRVLGVYILGIKLGMDIAGVWLAILLDLTVRAVFLTYKFKEKTIEVHRR